MGVLVHLLADGGHSSGLHVRCLICALQALLARGVLVSEEISRALTALRNSQANQYGLGLKLLDELRSYEKKVDLER